MLKEGIVVMKKKKDNQLETWLSWRNEKFRNRKKVRVLFQPRIQILSLKLERKTM